MPTAHVPDGPAGARGAPVEDGELLRRHLAGDPHAFGELVRRHQDRLWSVAMRTLGDREDAADALQNGLLSAHRAAGSFRGDAAVSTWLHRIVVNACLDLGRQRRARPVLPLRLPGTPGEQDPPSPRDDLLEYEAQTEVLAALRRLPPDQRCAVVLVDVEGYPVAEAAQILGVPQGTVKSRCARGRARLAVLLGRAGAAGGAGQGNAQDRTAVQPGGSSTGHREGASSAPG